MERVWWCVRGVALMCVAAAWGFGCDGGRAASPELTLPAQPDRAEREARGVVEAYLSAHLYGDMRGAFERHIESTLEGRWCRSEELERVLGVLRVSQTEAECEGARRVLDDAEVEAELTEEERFMLQTARFVCEVPQGDCVAYAWRVFESAQRSSVWWEPRMERFEVTRLEVKGDEAVAYVDAVYGSGMRRETLEVKRVGGGWRIVRGFTDGKGV